MLESHEEVAALTDGTGQERVGPYLEVLFHGRDASQGAFLSIGPNDDSDQLVIEAVPPEEDSRSTQQFPFPLLRPSVQTFKIVFQGQELTNSWFFSPYALSIKIAKNRRVYQSMGGFSFSKQSTAIACQSIGPELLSNNAIVELWDAIGSSPKLSVKSGARASGWFRVFRPPYLSSVCRWSILPTIPSLRRRSGADRRLG